MIISDLNYLEVVAEVSSVVGGHDKLKHKKGNNKGNDKIRVLAPVESVNQNNISVLNQIAISTAVALSKEGDAEANSVAKNDATVAQVNQS